MSYDTDRRCTFQAACRLLTARETGAEFRVALPVPAPVNRTIMAGGSCCPENVDGSFPLQLADVVIEAHHEYDATPNYVSSSLRNAISDCSGG